MSIFWCLKTSTAKLLALFQTFLKKIVRTKDYALYVCLRFSNWDILKHSLEHTDFLLFH